MCDIEKIELMWLLFTGNIPRGVFCERRSQKTRDILTIEYNKNMALWNSFAKPYFYYKE